MKTNKLLLAFLVLALAISPLRSAWSVATTAQVDSPSQHCATMAMDSPLDEHLLDSTGTNSHPCEQDCDNSCCDNLCNTCTHSVISLTQGTCTPGEICAAFQHTALPVTYPQRSILPPLRPPASL